jgi:hypothetical protein
MKLSIPQIPLPEEREIRLSGEYLGEFWKQYGSANAPREHTYSYCQMSQDKGGLEVELRFVSLQGPSQRVKLTSAHTKAVFTAALAMDGLTLTELTAYGAESNIFLVIKATTGATEVKAEDPFNL